MDRRERSCTQEEMIRAAFDGMQAMLWTSLPGIVQSFNPTAMTCTVQPAVQGRVRAMDGTEKYVNYPLLLDVPVCFPGGGGCIMTFPVVAGDECLVVFADRCIDAWWQQGGVQPPMELRLHDLSDGFAFVGVRSQPNVVAGGVNASTAQLRTASGNTFVDVNSASETVRVHAGTVYEWDCHGYGQKIVWTGGKNYTVNNYGSDAIITTNNLPLSQPGPP